MTCLLHSRSTAMHIYFLSFAAAILALSAIATNAAVIITPAGAISSLPSLSNRPIGEAINGNGLSSGGASADILTETHSANSGNSGLYFVADGTGASPLSSLTMTFNLSAPSLVDTVHIWTYSRGGETDRAISSFDISFSTDGGSNYGTAIALTGWAQVPVDDIPVQSMSFASQSAVTHIRINNVVNHGDPSYTGLSEIRFGAVPEPSAALLGGLGGLLLLRRRR